MRTLESNRLVVRRHRPDSLNDVIAAPVLVCAENVDKNDNDSIWVRAAGGGGLY